MLKNRVAKLEQLNKPKGLVVVPYGYKHSHPDGMVVIYATDQDIRL